MRKVEFLAEDITGLGGRQGTLKVGEKEFETPLYLPIINLITGPPHVFRQGGIWKNIKNKLIKEENVDPFMTQILHFLDFDLPKKQLDKWRKKPFDERINERAGYSPTTFADSGGFKLLFYEGIDTSKYDISPIPEDILELQLDFGADIFASLDYPITHDLVPEEKKERRKKTIQNSLKTLDLMKNKENERAKDKLVLLPIHGYDFDSSLKFTKKMLEEIDKNGYKNLNFGLAIGSLVPLSMSQDYKRIIDIVAGILYGVKDYNDFELQKIPIHAFGVSSLGMPVLAAMGVDSFDSASYANSARNLDYKTEFNESSKKFTEINELSCDCKYCEKLKRGGLERAKVILSEKPMQEYDFDGEKINKSEIYALIACHNYEKTKKSIERIRKSIKKGNFLETLIDLYSSKNSKSKLDNYLQPMNHYYKDLLTKVKARKIESLPGYDNKSTRLKNIPLKKLDNFKSVSRETKETKSLSYTPNDYWVLETPYQPSKSKKVILFTSCSKEKPYSSSRTVQTLQRVIDKLDHSEKVEMIILSGMYGPVPLDHDKKEPVKKYDYKLHESNEERMDLLKKRTIKFMKKYTGGSYDFVAYLTSKPYREIIYEVKKEFNDLEILPQDPNTRTVKEFYKSTNLSKLEDSLKKKLEW